MIRHLVALTALCIFLPSGAAADTAVFPDVPTEHPSAAAIADLQARAVLKGMPDGLVRPDRRVSRAEFLTMLMRAKAGEVQEQEEPCISAPFPDVPDGVWFAEPACRAVREGIVDTTQEFFRPEEPITVGEASALLARAYVLAPIGEADPWYAPFLRAVAEKNVIPATLEAAAQQVTRGEMAEMIWRLETNRTDRPARGAEALLTARCDWVEEEQLPGVDIQEVRRVWLSWVNALRARQNLPAYRYHRTLNKSARRWSAEAKATGAITHKRPGQTAYYDFGMLTDWFASMDLSFHLHNGSLHTENIGWGMYRCAGGDCTEDMIDAIRTTFDFYVAEEGKSYRPHWNSMVNPDFTIAGLGISVEEGSGKYYLTAHYGTEIASNPAPVCP